MSLEAKCEIVASLFTEMSYNTYVSLNVNSVLKIKNLPLLDMVIIITLTNSIYSTRYYLRFRVLNIKVISNSSHPVISY